MDYVETEKNGGQQLEAYTGFAAVYDIFMDNVPYEEWGEYIHSLFKRPWNRGWHSFGSGLWHREQ